MRTRSRVSRSASRLRATGAASASSAELPLLLVRASFDGEADVRRALQHRGVVAVAAPAAPRGTASPSLQPYATCLGLELVLSAPAYAQRSCPCQMDLQWVHAVDLQLGRRQEERCAQRNRPSSLATLAARNCTREESVVVDVDDIQAITLGLLS